MQHSGQSSTQQPQAPNEGLLSRTLGGWLVTKPGACLAGGVISLAGRRKKKGAARKFDSWGRTLGGHVSSARLVAQTAVLIRRDGRDLRGD